MRTLIATDAPGRAFPSSVYATDEEYFSDAAKAYQTELQILHDAGIRYVQLDDPNLACAAFDERESSR